MRSIAHLKMLQSASAKLSRLNETAEIGETIADELRRLFDYHNCRVFVREGEELRLVAFRGDLMAATGGLERLSTTVGVGITGRVAETGEPLLVGDAVNCEFAHQIEGTPSIEESLLAVPLLYGARAVGVVVGLEARSRPVRLGRPAPARGARRPRGGGPRQRSPVRSPAA